VSANGIGTRASDDRGECRAHDDDVIRIADDGEEIRDQVYRRGEIGEEEPKTNSHPSRERTIEGEGSEET
jgi:hypothetical protein